MQITNSPKRFGQHRNAFGFLRLLLASLVIVSHTPEIVDGGRRREILTRLFHSLSFGELAVDGFFIISGFLITASFLNSSSTNNYLQKRILRIYPGFLMSSLLCVILVAPLAGGHFVNGNARGVAGVIVRMAVLCPPTVAGVFAGTYHQALNTAAWTIQYEFLCYLLIAALGSAGLLRSARLIGIAAISLLITYSIAPQVLRNTLDQLPLHDFILPADRMEIFRLSGLFLAGSAFYLGQSRIPLSRTWALAAFALLCATMFVPEIAHLGVAIFGSYVLFFLASSGSGTFLTKINDRNDISYGLYLYAFPIEKLLLWWHVSDSLIVVGILTWILAATAGGLSWFMVEKPVMQWGRPKSRVVGRNSEPDIAAPDIAPVSSTV